MMGLKSQQRSLLIGLFLSVAMGLGGCNSSSSNGSSGSTSSTQATPRGVNSTVAMPVLTGPIEGGLKGRPWGTIVEELAPLEPGYMQEEYFYGGTAAGILQSGELDGSNADYTTRMLVVRPKNQHDFNGTVLVEWFNVTAEMEIDVVWAQVYKEALREGYAYVGISVQQVGVSASPLGIKYWDPVRYQPLNHPGDVYAYDMLAQGVRALFAEDEIQPLGDLAIERIIASGESQSAALLIPYINKVDPDHQLFDGYFVHTFPGVIDEDVSVPVLMLLTDTEVEGITSPVGYASQSPEQIGDIFGNIPGAGILAIPNPVSAPADFDKFRVWEVAGGSHYDKQGLVYASAQLSRDLTAPIDYTTFSGVPIVCPEQLGLDDINQLGLQRPARAALHALNDWIITGKAPATQPRISRNEDGTVMRDTDDLAMGGIRMPSVAVPVGLNEGKSCVFFGRYTAFDGADITSRYPTKAFYIAQFLSAAQAAVDKGVLLLPEVDEYLEEAEAIDAW